MSKKHHDRQTARARTKRRKSAADRRATRNRAIVVLMVALMVLSLVAGALVGLFGGDDDPVAATPDDDAVAAEESPAADGPCGPTPDDLPEVDSQVYDEPFPVTIDEDAVYVATFDTTCGTIVAELDPSRSPLTVNNFVNLAEDGYYDGVVFHRVIPNFVAQAGDPAGTGCGQQDCTAEGFDPDAPTFPGYQIEDELDWAEELVEQVRADLLAELGDEGGDAPDPEQVPGGYPRGVLAMANAGPDTNGSQFFITQGDPTLLPGPQFSVFGEVVEGMEIVDAIVLSPTDALDRPLADVVIRSVTITQR